MSLVDAIRFTEILVGFAFAQQSIEHLKSYANEQRLDDARESRCQGKGNTQEDNSARKLQPGREAFLPCSV